MQNALRRQFLIGLTSLAAVPAASALSLEPAPAEVEKLYLTRCGSQQTHQRIALITTRLLRQRGMSAAAIEADLAASACPFCGCGLTNTAG